MSKNPSPAVKIGAQAQPARRSLYVQLSPATSRYHRLLELAAEYNCSYHTIALTAIDWYLRTQAPKKA